MFRNLKLWTVFCAVIILIGGAVVGHSYWAIAVNVAAQKLGPKKSVADRLRQYSAQVQQRLAHDFARAGVEYPPARVALLGFKKERRLEIHAAGRDGIFKFIRSYPILGASGSLGPKLREGDAQVPEGLYAISFLNPNSLYHLSLRLNYPNDFDCAQARLEKRQPLGGDIMIHGSFASAGCLAMGDEAAEDLFVLVALTGIQNARVVLSPVDFRTAELSPMPAGAPAWTQLIYDQIRSELGRYQTSRDGSLEGRACSTI